MDKQNARRCSDTNRKKNVLKVLSETKSADVCGVRFSDAQTRCTNGNALFVT